jgi:hypothetical protein
MLCARRASGITIIRNAQIQKFGKPNNLIVFGSNKTKGLNKIAKIGYGNLCLREENISLDENYII